MQKVKRISEITGIILSGGGEQTRSEVLKWIETKTGQKFSDEVYNGNPFSNENEQFSVETVNIGDPGQNSLWMLQYQHPCSQSLTRKWVTEISVGAHPNGNTLFGLRLNAHDTSASDFQRTSSTTPAVLRKIVENLGLAVDGREISTAPEYLDIRVPEVEEQVDSMIDFVSDHRRTKPVVLVSADQSGQYPVNLERFSSKLCGMAHVYGVSRGASFLISDKISKQNGAYNGAIRVYMPDVDLENPDPQLSHLYFRSDFRVGGSFESYLTNRLYDYALRKRLSESDFPSFAKVKSIFLENLQLQVGQKTPSPDESLREQFEIQAKQIKTMQEEIDLALSLAAEADEARTEAERERDAALEKVEELENKTSQQQSEQKLAAPPKLKGLYPPFSLIADWTEAYFGSSLILSPRALKEVRSPKYNVYRNPDIIYQGLRCLGQMATIKDFNGDSVKAAFEKDLRSIGMEDRISVSASSAGLYGDTYYTSVDGEKVFLGKHLVKGGARNPLGCLRIYYGTSELNDNVVVGSLPRHLENSMT